ncbi:MAG: hypothetical protein ACYTFZ_02950 [Planctomycetota bacterium]|jgi:hypothetical protein
MKGFRELLIEKDSGSALVLAYLAIFGFIHYLKIEPSPDVLWMVTIITCVYIIKELGVTVVKHIWNANGEED